MFCNLPHDGKRKTRQFRTATLIFRAAVSLFSFVLYFYSANHAPYTYIDVIFWGPLCSFIGIVISIISRKSRKIHPALWISGIISCMLGFIVCMFVFSMLMNHRSEESQVHSKIECLSKNERAIQFYLREEFSIQSESLDSNTGEKELIMVWKR